MTSTEQTTDAASVIGRPWRRLIARSFDQTLYGITWAVIQFFILRWHWQNNIVTNLLESYIMLAMMIAIEPALLASWGTTPGKKIMGLEIRNTDGSRLTYRQGFDRMLGVFSKGLGYGIPIYNLVRCWRSSEATLNGETLEWDEGLSYRLKDTRPVRGWLVAAAYVTALACAFFIISQSQLPVNRGDLTPEAYAANINDMLSRPVRRGYGQRLTAEGKWVASNEYDSGMVIYRHGGPLPDHQMTIEKGLVTGVSFEIKRTGDDFFQSAFSQQKEMMIMAFVGAQRGTSGYQLLFRSGLEGLLTRQESYTHEIGDIKITNRLEHQGYNLVGDWLMPISGEEQVYHLVFSLEKVE